MYKNRFEMIGLYIVWVQFLILNKSTLETQHNPTRYFAGTDTRIAVGFFNIYRFTKYVAPVTCVFSF